MDKVLLKKEDIDFLMSWRDKHKDLVRLNISPLKSVKIICQDENIKVQLTAVKKGTVLHLVFNENGVSLGNVEFQETPSGMYTVKKDNPKFSKDIMMALLTVYSTVMAFITFGNDTIALPEPRKYERYDEFDTKESKKSHNRTNKKGATYILKRSGKNVHVAISGAHASPAGIFSVRGHYRHYKDGRVVWINEFKKGTGKKKSKTYKI